MSDLNESLALSEELLAFIKQSPSMFHTTQTIKEYLLESGFTYLSEGSSWDVQPGGSYFTARNNSSIVAWKVGEKYRDVQTAPADAPYHFQLAVAHGDSPTYKVKAQPELTGDGNSLRLNTEAYGGMLDHTWFDRPLGIAGRVLVKVGNKVESRLVNIEDDVVMIPSLAIHLEHKNGLSPEFNRAKDLMPLFSAGELNPGAFNALVADAAGVSQEDIFSRDLFLVDHTGGRIWGAKKEFVSAGHLDDLQCAFVALKAFLASSNEQDISVYTCFDNEEVGSNTKQGAKSTFLKDTLQRVNATLGFTQEDYYRALSASLLVSCDNAHAVHPNYPEKHDVANKPYLNGGMVIKEAARQSYCTDAFSRAIVEAIWKQQNVPYQVFANRSDMPGGSTLGNLSNIQASMHAVDVGLPQLAMHSVYETAGTKDTLLGYQALKAFYDTCVCITDADSFELR